MPYVEYDEVEAICPDCGRNFRSDDALASHREDSHSGRDEPPVGTSAPGARTCSVCHQSFDSATTLRSHLARRHPRA
jgi:hypothetical protein